MAEVVKIIELVGESPKSFEEATKTAVERAVKTLRGVVGIDVKGFSMKIKNGKVVAYRSNVNVAFVLE